MVNQNPDPAAPILLFDSGIGGLTVLGELRAQLPDAPVIYAADLAGLPYGQKTEAEIAARVVALLGRMSERYNPRLICIACNTASTIALEMVRDVLNTRIVGTVPAIKPAAEHTQTGVIGLLGTMATIRQTYVDNLEQSYASDKLLLRQAAPGLVRAAEAKLRGQPVDMAAIESATGALKAQPGAENLDVVVLACTHFPLLSDELQACFGPDVRLVHGASGIARRIAHLTAGEAFARHKPDMAVTTGPLADFGELRPALETYGLKRFEKF